MVDSEEETLKAPTCPSCQGETDAVQTQEGRILFLCPKCDEEATRNILATTEKPEA